MFGALSLSQLQEYWWLIFAILGALFVFMTFVQGGQTLLHTLGKTEQERDLLVNSLGRKWELTFTSIVMFGGALFAAFPKFYSVSFGGAYFVWMGILFTFIVQAVSYEYRKKASNFFGTRVYEIFMYINGSVGIFLIGVFVGTLFTGGHFYVNSANLSHWTNSTYGLGAVLNPFNDIFGLMLVFLARVQGNMYFINNVAEEDILRRAKTSLAYSTVLFVIAFLYVVVSIIAMNGFALDPQTHVVFIQPHKYLHNLLDMPVLLVMLLVGALMVLGAIYATLLKGARRGIWFSGIGTILVVMSLFLTLGYGNTAYYPSLSNLQSSLTIYNSSSSHYTLTVMSYVSLMVPFVLAYIFWAWRAMDMDKITIKEIESDSHHY